MPMIDVKCSVCGEETETFRHTSQLDEPLPNCCEGATVERIYVFQRPHSFTGIDPVIVYRNPDGSIGIPGHRDGRIPDGSQRLELRTAADVRRIEKEMSSREYSKFMAKQEREEKTFGEYHRQQRAELLTKAQGFSQRGRDFAMAAIKQNNEAPRKRFQTNVFFDAFSNSASNRDGYRGDDHRSGRK